MKGRKGEDGDWQRKGLCVSACVAGRRGESWKEGRNERLMEGGGQSKCMQEEKRNY